MDLTGFSPLQPSLYFLTLPSANCASGCMKSVESRLHLCIVRLEPSTSAGFRALHFFPTRFRALLCLHNALSIPLKDSLSPLPQVEIEFALI